MSLPIQYLQTDSRWSNRDYSASGESTTIGRAGCGPTCMAMVIATLKDKAVTPVLTATWALKNGYKAANQGTYYSYFSPQGAKFGISVKQQNVVNLRKMNPAAAAVHHGAAEAAIKAGKWVICCMGQGLWTTSGHYILWYGMENGKALIRDPNSIRPERTKGDLALLKSQVKYYWIVDVPKGEEEVEKRYNSLEEIPTFAKPTIKKLVDKGLLSGGSAAANDLNLSLDMIRLLVIQDKAGLYK